MMPAMSNTKEEIIDCVVLANFCLRCTMLPDPVSFQPPTGSVPSPAGPAGGINDTLKITVRKCGEDSETPCPVSLVFYTPLASRLAFLQPRMLLKVFGKKCTGGWGQGSRGALDIESTNFQVSSVFVEESTDSFVELNSEGSPVWDKPHHPLWVARLLSYQQTCAVQAPFTPLTAILNSSYKGYLVNVAGCFMGNLAPGARIYNDARKGAYTANNILLADLSLRALTPEAIRVGAGGLPSFSVQCLQTGQDLSKLPWLTVGDIVVARRFKPTVKMDCRWALYHQNKAVGDSRLAVIPIEAVINEHEQEKVASIIDGSGLHIATQLVIELRDWIKESLSLHTLLASEFRSNLNDLTGGSQGVDLVAQVLGVSKQYMSITVDDYSGPQSRRTIKMRDDESAWFVVINARESQWLLLRNVRLSDSTIFVNPQYCSKLPEWCYDVQELIQRKQRIGVSDEPLFESQDVNNDELTKPFLPATPVSLGFEFTDEGPSYNYRFVEATQFTQENDGTFSNKKAKLDSQ